jgi:hypothetical protein
MQFMKFMDNNMEQNEGLYRQQNKIKQETHWYRMEKVEIRIERNQEVNVEMLNRPEAENKKCMKLVTKWKKKGE